MGNQQSRGTFGTFQIENLIGELAHVVYKGPLGEHGRFFKTSVCVHDDGGPVVVKTYLKRSVSDDVTVYQNALLRVQATLSKRLGGGGEEEEEEKKKRRMQGAHVWSDEKVIQTPQAVHIVRQYFWSSLAQRMTSRPFLTVCEKLWIGYQLLRAVEQAHACDVCHGDVKTENIMLTSWGWLFLIDFSPYKPTHLPADNPSDFSIFFDTSGKRKCCLAPERFVRGNVTGSNELRPEMDVFSAGCALAELFSDGASVFEYSDVLELARNRSYPSGFFEAIDDRVVDCVRRMVELDPKQRPTAAECVAMYVALDDVGSDGVGLLHRVSESLLVESPENRARVAEECFRSTIMPYSGGGGGKGCVSGERWCRGDGEEEEEEEEEMGRVLRDYMNIHTLEVAAKNLIQETRGVMKETETSSSSLSVARATRKHDTTTARTAEAGVGSDVHDGGEGNDGILQSQFVVENIAIMYCSLIRGCTNCRAKVLLLYHIEQCCRLCRNKDVILYVAIPHYITAATDIGSGSRTKCFAMAALPRLFAMIDLMPASASHFFADYVFPSISLLPNDVDLAVRSAYSRAVGRIGVEASRTIRSENVSIVQQREELKRVSNWIERGVHDILVGSSPLPKLALLPELREISFAIGRKGTADGLLPALLTLFNSREWDVRAALYSALQSIAPVLGPRAVSFILPFIDRIIHDSDSMASTVGLKLVQHLVHARLLNQREVVHVVERIMESGMIRNPCNAVRGNLVSLIQECVHVLGSVASEAMLLPKVWAALPSSGDVVLSVDDMDVSHLLPAKDIGNLAPIVEDGRPFHAEFASQSLEVYTVKFKPSTGIGRNMRPASKLQQALAQVQGRRRGGGVSRSSAATLLRVSSVKRNHSFVRSQEKKREAASVNVEDIQQWRPRGILVARIPCHSRSISQVSSNISGTTMFATASRDGTVKLWDSRRMERDISFRHRSMLEGTSGYSSISPVPDVGGMKGFIVGGMDGKVTTWDVEQASSSEHAGAAAWDCGPGRILDSGNLARTGVTIVTSEARKVFGIDHRSPSCVWKVDVEASFGVPLRLAVDAECPHFFMTGTNRGYITAWDVRFMIPVKTWRNPASAPVESLALTTGAKMGVSSTGPVLLSACGDCEISGWDAATGVCKIVFVSKENSADNYVPESLVESTMKHRNTGADPLGLARQFGAADLRALSTKRTSVKSIYITSYGSVLSGGIDKTIRLWEPRSVKRSYIVAGPHVSDPEQALPKSSFSYNARTHKESRVIVEEKTGAQSDDRAPQMAGTESICHRETVTSLMQVMGQTEPLLASSSADGVLNVWR